MFVGMGLGIEFFEGLLAKDRQIAEEVRVRRCPHCGGPLHCGDYSRKPRFGRLSLEIEQFARRFSFCCGREGCRRRLTPPSVRFFGRRVYVGAIVMLASIATFVMAFVRATSSESGVPLRTLRRWRSWWQGPFLQTPCFIELSGRLVPKVDPLRIPASLFERLPSSFPENLHALLRTLTPLTTASCSFDARFLGDSG